MATTNIQRHKAANHHVMDTSLWCIMAYEESNNVSFLSYNGVCQTCWILYHKLTYRICSGYRRPCAHYKALHTMRGMCITHYYTLVYQPDYSAAFHIQKREQANTAILSKFNFQIPFASFSIKFMDYS